MEMIKVGDRVRELGLGWTGKVVDVWDDEWRDQPSYVVEFDGGQHPEAFLARELELLDH